MIVYVPTPLRSYTGEVARVQAEGETLGSVLEDLDEHYPGIRFRIIDEHDRVRQHIKLFVGEKPVEDLGRRLAGEDALHIICALSGGMDDA